MQIASAGMPGPLYLSGKGCQALELSGIPPGLLPEATYDITTLRLQPGESLLFCTDGITEAFDMVLRKRLIPLERALESSGWWRCAGNMAVPLRRSFSQKSRARSGASVVKQNSMTTEPQHSFIRPVSDKLSGAGRAEQRPQSQRMPKPEQSEIVRLI